MVWKTSLQSPLVFWKSRSLKMKVFSLVLVCVAIFLTGLPYLVKWGMVKTLNDQGIEQVYIEDVSLNLFSGRIKVEGLTLKGADKPALSLGELLIDLDWLSIFQKRLVIEQIDLLNTNIDVIYHPQQSINVAGIIIPLTKEESEIDQEKATPITWSLGVNHLSLVHSNLHIVTPEFNKKITFEKVTLSHLQNWSPALSANLKFNLAMGEGKDDGRFNGQFSITPFAEKQSLSGQVKINNLLLDAYEKLLPPSIKRLEGQVDGTIKLTLTNHFGKINGQAQTDLSLQKGALEADGFAGKVGKIGFKGQSSIEVKDHQLSVTSGASVSLLDGSLVLNQQSVTANLHQVNWEGQIALSPSQPASKTTSNPKTTSSQSLIAIKGHLTGDSLDVKQGALALLGNGFDWVGQVKVQTEGDLEPSIEQSRKIATSGQVSFDQWSLRNPSKVLNLASFKALTTDTDFESPQTLSLKHFQINQLKVGEFEKDRLPLMSFKQLLLSDLKLTPSQTTEVGQVEINDLSMKLNFDDQRKLPQLEAMESSLRTVLPAEKPTAPETTQTKAPLALRFEGLKLTGKNNIELLTLATQPSMHKKIEIQTLSIGKINFQKPNQNTPLKLVAKIDKYTKLQMEGRVKPLTPKVNVQLKTTIQDMDLFSFSPLIQRDLGYRIQSGSLNLTSQVDVVNNQLKSKNHVLLRSFSMAADDTATDTVSDSKKTDLGMSTLSNTANKTQSLMSATALKFGLDMLRDGHNNIDLDLPIEGNLADPSFDATSAIGVALRNALSGGTKLALTLALQPYGAIAMITSYAYNQASKIAFQPVKFEVGSAKLSPSMPDYLDKMGKLLAEKKQITLKVCGYYTQQDVDYWSKQDMEPDEQNQKLYDIALQRQSLVKDWLVEKGKIDSSRLTTCHPEKTDSAVTGVSLTM